MKTGGDELIRNVCESKLQSIELNRLNEDRKFLTTLL